jgi:hypothetical protein
MPFLKNYAKPPFPIISEDPKLKPLEQDAEYPFTTGYPGPLTPAADEIYQQFVMVDALAQFATDKMDGPRQDQGDLREVRLASENTASRRRSYRPPRGLCVLSSPTESRPAVLPSTR